MFVFHSSSHAIQIFSFKGLPSINFILLYFNIFKSIESKGKKKSIEAITLKEKLAIIVRKTRVSWEYSLYTAITA